MTQQQYYFPYFFILDIFNKELESFGLTSFVTYDDKNDMPVSLNIINKNLLRFINIKNTVHTISFGATIMIQKDKLFYWKTNYDIIDITRFSLTNPADQKTIETCRINLLEYSLGKTKFENDFELNDFVTYVRKENLKYDLTFYERFVIVFIDNGAINILPFDWFNKTGGDYGYVWPAIARFDKRKRKLYGQGMRMGDFEVELNLASL